MISGGDRITELAASAASELLEAEEEGAVGALVIVFEVLVPAVPDPLSSVVVYSHENRFAKEGLLAEGIRVGLGG